RILELVGNIFTGVVILFLLRECRELLATHKRYAIAQIHAEQPARAVTDCRHEFTGAPSAHDSSLNIRIARDVDLGDEAARYQDGVVVRGIQLGQLAAAIEPAEGLALEELLLSGIFRVVGIVRRPSTPG